ncbi:MAG: ATP-binding protein [Elusimicrobiota bacterium]
MSALLLLLILQKPACGAQTVALPVEAPVAAGIPAAAGLPSRINGLGAQLGSGLGSPLPGLSLNPTLLLPASVVPEAAAQKELAQASPAPAGAWLPDPNGRNDAVSEIKNTMIVGPNGWLKRVQRKLTGEEPKEFREALDRAIATGAEAERIATEIIALGAEKDGEPISEREGGLLSELKSYLQALKRSQGELLAALDGMPEPSGGAWSPGVVSGVLKGSVDGSDGLQAKLLKAEAAAADPARTAERERRLHLVHDLKNAATVAPVGWLKNTYKKLDKDSHPALARKIEALAQEALEFEKLAREYMSYRPDEALPKAREEALLAEIRNRLEVLRSGFEAVPAMIGAVSAEEAAAQRWSPETLRTILLGSIGEISRLSDELWGTAARPRTPASLRRTVAETVERLSKLLKAAGVSLELDLRCSEDGVFNDKAGLERIVANLVMNAADAMAGSTERTLRLSAFDLPGGRAAMEFSDTGPGMDAETADKVRRGEAFSTKGPEKGSGQGLPSVRAAVLAAGGSFTVRSEKGAGTTFRVELPVLR